MLHIHPPPLLLMKERVMASVGEKFLLLPLLPTSRSNKM